MDVSALNKGVRRRRRSTSEANDSDCDNAKKSSVDIKQSAVSAIPGRNEESISSNDKKSKVKDVHEYLVLPKQQGVLSDQEKKKDALEKPNKKHSPLWSLSKLIETVNVKSDKKTNISPKQNTLSLKNAKAVEKGSGKSSLATDPAKAIKATLSKAIEKVEKVIANKNANQITPHKGEVRESKPTESSKSTSNNTLTTTKTISEPSVKATLKDPYTEIALGPDRPKIPDLKSDSAENSNVMRMGEGDVKSSATSAAMKGEKPLAGEHDVGGLLDRLTDKLNSGGLLHFSVCLFIVTLMEEIFAILDVNREIQYFSL